MNELKERNELMESEGLTNLAPKKQGSRKDRIKNIAITNKQQKPKR